MEASDPLGNLTIDDLPNELLAKIFNYNATTWRNDRCIETVIQVCQRWYYIVDTKIGRIVKCSRSASPMVIHPSNPDVSQEGLALISEIGVRSLEIEARNSDNLVESPTPPLPSFKRPYLLETLHVRGPLHRDLFNSLVKGTINISKLHISLAALYPLGVADLKNLTLPKLRDLKLQRSFIHYRDEILALPNLRTLLKENQFPRVRLESLDIGFPLESFQDLETVKVLIPFIQGHHALNSLIVRVGLPRRRAPVNQSVYLEDMETIITGIRGHGGSPSLKTLLVFVADISQEYPQLEILEEFVKQQTSLQSLSLGIGVIPVGTLKTISSRNRESLTHLSISIGRQAHGLATFEMDCSVLSPLQSLRYLSFYGDFEINGTRHLPPSLVTISVYGILTSDELEHVLLNLPNLRRTYYTSLRNGSEFRPRLETLERVVQNRRIGFVRLSCDQDSFPPGGIPNGDPVNPIMLGNPDWRGWALNQDGYYYNWTYT